MDLHQNARLSFRSREALANKIILEKLTLKAAAAAFNVSRKTAAKWAGGPAFQSRTPTIKKWVPQSSRTLRRVGTVPGAPS
jgi:leucine-zipper of insertion element IS481